MILEEKPGGEGESGSNLTFLQCKLLAASALNFSWTLAARGHATTSLDKHIKSFCFPSSLADVNSQELQTQPTHYQHFCLCQTVSLQIVIIFLPSGWFLLVYWTKEEMWGLKGVIFQFSSQFPNHPLFFSPCASIHSPSLPPSPVLFISSHRDPVLHPHHRII